MQRQPGRTGGNGSQLDNLIPEKKRKRRLPLVVFSLIRRSSAKKAPLPRCFFFKLGYKDSNLEMTESESVALPFGDSPIQRQDVLYSIPDKKASTFLIFFIFF
jgi:hypothetical protein